MKQHKKKRKENKQAKRNERNKTEWNGIKWNGMNLKERKGKEVNGMEWKKNAAKRKEKKRQGEKKGELNLSGISVVRSVDHRLWDSLAKHDKSFIVSREIVFLPHSSFAVPFASPQADVLQRRIHFTGTP
eukprot:scaffold67241_cov16-Prasinocladus_malaysianus.AAC.1